MNCEETQNLIDEAAWDDWCPNADEPALTSEQREELDAHLSWCSSCREDFEFTKKLGNLLHNHHLSGQLETEAPGSGPEVSPQAPEVTPEISPEATKQSLKNFYHKLAKVRDESDEPTPWINSILSSGPSVPEHLRGPATNTTECFTSNSAQESQPQQQLKYVCGIDVDQSDPEETLDATLPIYSILNNKRILSGLALAACLAVIAAIGWFNTGLPDDSALNPIRHSIELIAASNHQSLPLGQIIDSGNQKKKLLLGSKHKVVMNIGTQIVINELVNTTDGYAIDLRQGELYVEVVPDNAFEVSTPNANLTITGTKFDVLAKQNLTELTLIKGSVEFASKGNEGDSVSVISNHTSRIVGDASPTLPAQTDGQSRIAWVNQPESAESQQTTFTEVPLVLDGVDESMLPKLEDYSKWSYQEFIDEKREWFGVHFPWAIKLEKELNKNAGNEIDYLDLLMVSGEIWCFDYPVKEDHKKVNRLDLDAAIRLSKWFGLTNEQLSSFARPNEKTTELTIREQSDQAMKRWMDELGQKDQGLPMNSIAAASFLHTTRQAVLHWIKEHPSDAERLLAEENYCEHYLPELVPQNSLWQLDAFLKTLEQQFDICSQCYIAGWQIATDQLQLQCDLNSKEAKSLKQLVEKLRSGEDK